MSLTPQWLDELRARTSLSTLIGKSIKVQKAGREYKACCPFHNEKTPSFTINDDKGFYHCFGCGAHGDAIRWMTDQRGLPFMDAVKELADAAGMEVPALDPRAAKRAEQAQSLHDVTQAAQDWFVEQLNSLDGAEARAYLQKRGITPATIDAFGLGFAPDSRSRLKTALKAFPESMLVEAGMLIQPDDTSRESYDRFRGRLMIPIRNQRGRVIAFGGRILGAGEPKYLNSPETPLFDKGRTLYNLDKAAPAARKSGRIIVVEGYMDAIMIAQSGIAEVVAPLGTALTEAQIERLWTMAETPILCLDGDAAGQRAALRAAHRALPLLKPGQSLAFATLPAGMDPDDIIRSSGVETFSKFLQLARPLVEIIWEFERNKEEAKTPEQRAGLQKRLNEMVVSISDPLVRRQYAEQMRTKFFSEFGWGWRLRERAGVAKFMGETRTEIANIENMAARINYALHRAVLLGLSRWPSVIYTHREMISALRRPSAKLDGWCEILINASYQRPFLEEDLVQSILEQEGLPGETKRDIQNDLAYVFYHRHSDPDLACLDLAKVIEALNVDQTLDDQIASFEAHLQGQMKDRWMEDGDWIEQRRLHDSRARINADIYEFKAIAAEAQAA